MGEVKINKTYSLFPPFLHSIHTYPPVQKPSSSSSHPNAQLSHGVGGGVGVLKVFFVGEGVGGRRVGERVAYGSGAMVGRRVLAAVAALVF